MRRFCTLTCIVLTLLVCTANAQPVRETQEYVDAAYARMWRQEHRHAEQPLLATPPPCCQWTTPVIIDVSTPNLSAQNHAAITTAPNGDIFAAWTESNQSASQILVQRSTNRGETWIRNVAYGFSSSARILRDIAVDSVGNVWILWTSRPVQSQPYNLNLSKSTDAGQTFSTEFTAREYAAPYFEPKLAVDRQNNVFVLWDDQQFKLTRFRNGDVNQRIDTEIPNDTLSVDFWCSLAIGPEHNVYAIWIGVQHVPSGLSRYRVYCSTLSDTGTTIAWNARVDTTEPPYAIYAHRYPASAVDASGSLHVAFMRLTGIPDSMSIVAASSNTFGSSFRPFVTVVEFGTNTDSYMTVDATNSVSMLWRGSNGATFSRSTDGGRTFGRPRLIGYEVAADICADRLGNLFALFETGYRITFVRTNVLVTVDGNDQQFTTIELLQNYPNPFNPSTTFAFSLPSSFEVRLAVFDILGREVEEVIHQRLAAGWHTFEWRPNEVASGLYLYRLVAKHATGTTTVARKLIFVR